MQVHLAVALAAEDPTSTGWPSWTGAFVFSVVMALILMKFGYQLTPNTRASDYIVRGLSLLFVLSAVVIISQTGPVSFLLGQANLGVESMSQGLASNGYQVGASLISGGLALVFAWWYMRKEGVIVAIFFALFALVFAGSSEPVTQAIAGWIAVVSWIQEMIVGFFGWIIDWIKSWG